MKKAIKTLFVFVSIFFGLSVFATTNSKTFLETISEEKMKIEYMFDQSYSAVYQQFQTSIGGFSKSSNYQGLVCLGVISDTLLLQQMQNDIKNLKVGFLNAYAIIYADAFDIEQKNRILIDNSLSLFASGVSYQMEKDRIMSNLAQLSTSQKSLTTQFQQNYNTKITQFVKDFEDYTDKNKDLLTTVSIRINSLKNVEQKYKKLTSDLLDYQIKLSGSGTKFFSKLHLIKQASVSGLDLSFQNIINRAVKTAKILPNLQAELSQQKQYALGLFEMQIDEKINLLLDQWYDNKEFSQIKKDVDSFSSMYSSAGKLSCSSFISSDSFIQNSQSLLSKIDNFSKTFSKQNLSGVSNSGFQTSVMNRFPVIIQLQKDITKTFTMTVSQKKQALLDEYRKKTEPVSQVEPVVVPLPSADSFQFTKPFKNGESSSDIKILQQLLINLGYYKGQIDGVYSQQTLQSVYQYQLAKNLLKGYENKTSTWGWMGPSTRASLNKDLLK